MMYLLDTNIFLEILLDQKKSDECEILLRSVPVNKEKFYVSSFTLHTIEVKMTRESKEDYLKNFLRSVDDLGIKRLDTPISEEIKILDCMDEQGLSFDDAVQYHICKKNDFEIISYDEHFDGTDITRKEPSDIIF